MNQEIAQARGANWLLDNGPGYLESLVRAIIYRPSAPILVLDDERKLWDASVGAAKLLGLPRDQVVGNKIDNFVAVELKPQVPTLWRQWIGSSEHEGRLKLTGPNGNSLEVEFQAKSRVLPVRHLFFLRAATISPQTEGSATSGEDGIASWLQDFAAFLLDEEGLIVAWYPGAERIYGYADAEAVGKHISLLYPRQDDSHMRSQKALHRAASEGHFVSELWNAKKMDRDFGPTSSPWR